MDRAELVTTVGRAVILTAQLEEALQDLVVEQWRVSGGSEAAADVRPGVLGKSGEALVKQLDHAGLKVWAIRYPPISLDRNALVHSLWYPGDDDSVYARRYRPGGVGAWDVVASPWSDARFAAFVTCVEDALIDCVNDLWRTAGLPENYVYTRKHLPV